MTDLLALILGGMFAATVAGVSMLAKMASDLTIIRRIAQAHEVRADEQWRREHEDLITRLHERAGLPRRSTMYRPAEKDPGGAA